ncbi:ester cyclase [Pontibacter saemangeumensis]|uniref:Ester cyclase n=1 Tax=Pontibacter saemangeumensis TaxID=1084525 RepID=A0ABP8L9J5_9BACT
MSAEENGTLVRRFIDEIFNQGKLEVAEEILARDYVHHDPTTSEFGSGIEGFKQMVSLYRQAFDLQIVLEDQIVSGDKVVDRWTGHGTHKGAFMGMAPTGKSISSTGISIHRIASGKIAETWNNYDALGIFQQLGIVPGQKQ